MALDLCNSSVQIVQGMHRLGLEKNFDTLSQGLAFGPGHPEFDRASSFFGLRAPGSGSKSSVRPESG